MDWIIQSGIYKPKDVKILNYCRIYLNVCTVSELFDASGNTMLHHMYHCHRPLWFNPQQFLIIQRRPSQYQIDKKWKVFCQQWCSPQTLHRKPSIPPFGSWTHSSGPRPRRESYVDPSATPRPAYYYFNEQAYWKMNPIPALPNTFTLAEPTTWLPPSCAIPIQMRKITNIHFYSDTPVIPTPPPPIPPALPAAGTVLPGHYPTFPSFGIYLFNKTPSWQRKILHNVKVRSSPFDLNNTFQDSLDPNRPITLISYGISTSSCTKFGWSLCSIQGNLLFTLAYRMPKTFPRHRAAAWANYSAALFLKHIFLYLNTTPPPASRLHIITTNRRLAKRMAQRNSYTHPFPNTTLEPDWDLTETTHLLFSQEIKITPTYFFPTKKPPQDPSLPTTPKQLHPQYIQQQRKTAITLADSNRHDVEPELLLLQTIKCELTIDTRPIRSDYLREYREAASLPQLKGYLRNKMKWTADTHLHIQWSWFQAAILRYKHRSSHSHLVKLIHRQLATPAQLHKTGGQSWRDPICPHCARNENKTFDHMLQCNLPDAIDFRKNLINRITKHLSHRTPNRFMATMLEGIESWLWHGEPLRDPTHPPELLAALRAQSEIGWSGFLCGYLSSSWATYLRFETLLQNPQSTDLDFDQLFVGLIYELWASQTDFWTAYQARRHSLSTCPSHDSKRNELITTIQHLYSQRPHVEPTNRDRYYPSDLDAFLTDSTTSQLQNYVHNYGDAIRLSVKRHKKTAVLHTPALWQYPGFRRFSRTPTLQPHPTGTNGPPGPSPPRPTQIRRTVQSIRNWLLPHNQHPLPQPGGSPIEPAPPPPPPPPTNPQNSHTGATPHHKHTRWRNLHSVQRRFRSFFVSSAKPPTPHP